jgi:polyisoprenoid-binding protein YceI
VRRFALLTACTFTALPAYAAHWNVDPVTSQLRFEGEQAGEKFEGSFPKFSSTINFDEAAPEKGSMHIAITTSAVQIDGKDRMDAWPTADWFAVKDYPFAEYTANSFKKTEEHQYVALGTLTIRGISKALALPFTFKTVDKSAIATGEVTINRKDFGVGQGRWTSDEWVKYPVKISYTIRATAQ